MSRYTLVKIPSDKHQKALRLQSTIMLRDGKRVPLWRCLQMLDNDDPFRRIRL